MSIPRFPADSGIALRGIALFPEIHQHRRTFRLCIQKPRQFLEADAVHIMHRHLAIAFECDHIADRQAVPLKILLIGQLLKFLDRNNSGLSVMFSSNIDESNPTWNAQELASNGKSVNMECNQ